MPERLPPQDDRPTERTEADRSDVVSQATLTLAADAAPTALLASPPPGYEILGVLGRGGMGVVYRARHVQLNCVVALKMIIAGRHAGSAERARFLAEAEAVASLQHPSIVRLLEYGEHEGQPYFTLEFAPGGSLADRLKGTPQPPREAARLVEQLARGIHHAHVRDIIHRDLKPANVLLAEDGTPKIADFGLVKRTEAEASLTDTGEVLGTPSYMAPEQAGGETKRVGPAADVYALGAILYECLTGRPPFRAATTLETVFQVVGTEPVPVRALQPRTPVDLATICHKCLQKEPSRRYASAQELAEDCAAFLEGRPIRARPVGQVERAWRWCRRNPVVAVLLALVVTLLLTGLAGMTLLYFRAEDQRQQADGARLDEARSRRDAVRQLIDVFTDNGVQAASRQDGAAALLWFARAVALSPEEPERENLNRIRISTWEADVGQPIRVLAVPRFRTPQDRYRVVEFHPAGRDLLVVTESGTAVVWDLPTQAIRKEVPASAGAWSPDGERLALASPDGHIVLYRGEDLREDCRIPARDKVRTLGFSPDGRLLAWAANGQVRLWDCADKVAFGSVRQHPGPVLALAFNARGDRLTTACQDGLARVFAVPGTVFWPGPVFSPVKHRCGDTGISHSLPRAPLFLPGGRELLTIEGDRVVWRDGETGKPLLTIPPPLAGHWVSGLSVSDDGAFLAITWANYGRVWDIARKKEVAQFDPAHDPTEDVAFHPGRRVFVTVGNNTRARFWEPQGDPDSRVLDQGWPLRHTAPAVLVRFAPVGPLLAVAQADGRIVVWRTPRASPPAFHRVTDGFSRVAASPDGGHFLLAGISFRNASLTFSQVHRVDDGLPAGPRLETRGLVIDGLFSGDGTTAILACSAAQTQAGRQRSMHLPDGQAGNVQFWDWNTGQRKGPPVPMPTEPRGLALSSKGDLLAVTCARGPVLLLDPETGRILHRLDSGVRTPSDPHLWWSNGLCCFDPTGTRLASWEMGRSVELWDVRKAKLLHRLPHGERVHEAVFDPTGQHLVTAGRDRKARVWEVESGKLIGSPLVHPRLVVRARFPGAPEEILTTCEDGIVRRWNFRSGRLLSSFSVEQLVSQDIALARDGSRLVGAALSGVAVFDLPLGRPLTPELAGSHDAQAVSVLYPSPGKRIIAGGLDRGVRGYDVSAMLRPTHEPGADLLRRAELIAGERVDGNGRMVPLTPDEWTERWRALTEVELPAWPGDWPAAVGKPAAILLEDALAGGPRPRVGRVLESDLPETEAKADEVGTTLSESARIVYGMRHFPPVDFTLSFWLRWEDPRGGAKHTLLSSAEGAAVDPLRLEIDHGWLTAKSILGWGSDYCTGGARLPSGRWVHVAVNKSGARLTVCLDGQPRGSARVPRALVVGSRELRLQWKPETMAQNPRQEPSIRVADLSLQEGAMSVSELRQRASGEKPPRSAP